MKDLEKLTCFIDLHSHLDGAISVENAKKLARLQGIKIPETDEEIERLLRVGKDCHDLNEFLEKFSFPCSLLKTRVGLTEATRNLLEELKADGMMYTELRFAPQLSAGPELTQEEAVAAVLAGMEQSELPAKLILCCMRGADNHEANLETVDVAARFLGHGVVALDLAGAEALFPTKDFEEIFVKAKTLGIPFTIHAGEADGPESIAAALEFGACRLGHGVRCLEDEEILHRITEKKIPLECCPTSNVETCIFQNIADFPLAKLRENGVIVTINTDDMSVCGTTIRGEWEKLVDAFSLTDADLRDMLLNSVEASFAEETLKEHMRRQILQEIPEQM